MALVKSHFKYILTMYRTLETWIPGLVPTPFGGDPRLDFRRSRVNVPRVLFLTPRIRALGEPRKYPHMGRHRPDGAQDGRRYSFLFPSVVLDVPQRTLRAPCPFMTPTPNPITYTLYLPHPYHICALELWIHPQDQLLPLFLFLSLLPALIRPHRPPPSPTFPTFLAVPPTGPRAAAPPTPTTLPTTSS